MFKIKPAGNSDLLKDQIYRQLMDMVCSGALTSGQLLTENQLVSKFKVSKSPVREALVRLCHEDVLQSLPRCGYQVIQVTTRDIHEASELRTFLELDSIPHILNNITEVQLHKLRDLSSQRFDTVSDGSSQAWAYWNNNLDFHLFLVSCAGNMQVIKELQRTFSVLTRAYAQLYVAQHFAIAADTECFHEEILQALVNQNTYNVHKLLKLDISCMKHLLLDADAKRISINAGN